jgi:acyl-CoA thioester hydrolase
VAYELRTEAGVHARATTVLTPFVFETGRPRRLTDDELARLETTWDEPPFAHARRERPAPWNDAAYHRPIQVRFSDVDLLGHVNNVRYFDYVHEAQVEVMTGVFQEARISGTVDMVVARSEMDHLGQMNVRPDPYDVWSRVAAVGRTSVTFESEIRDGERVMARSRVVEVNVDEDGQPLAHHPRHLELFEQRVRG